MTENEKIEIEAAAMALAENADVFFYSGPIDYAGYEQITKLCRMSDPRRNVVLILTTSGGDPHAAYRIARALRHNYNKLHLFIPRECKSAGTLLAIGATSLIISDRGEMGPLDVQISKPDEMFESNSGLDIMQALRVMQSEALAAFRGYLLDIKLGSGITMKASADIATKLAIGLFSPIYAQIDPVKLGEIQRAIAIAQAYGVRLNAYDGNLVDGGLESLILDYPSHGFVIDRKEARALFRKVRHAEPGETRLGEFLCTACPPREEPVVFNVLKQLYQGEENEQREFKSKSASASCRASAGNLAEEPENGRNNQEGDRKPEEISAT
jgi:hypothetical protein